MEPWDGPAGVAFTDGTVIGAVLDRNGLRPARWWHTADDQVILASEAGVLEVDPARVVAKGRLQPGRMFLVDTAAGRIVEDDEIKGELAAAEPYAQWVADGMVTLADLPAQDFPHPELHHTLRRQQIFGYTEEELRILLEPMADTGAEPTGSMGTDTPVAVLSQRPRLLFDYFSQLFAQVTNPPLDAIREELVTSLASTIGPDAQPAGRGAGGGQQDPAAVPGAGQRRAGQGPRRHRRACPRSPSPACTRWTAAATRWRRRSPGSGPRSSRRSRAAPGSSC